MVKHTPSKLDALRQKAAERSGVPPSVLAAGATAADPDDRPIRPTHEAGGLPDIQVHAPADHPEGERNGGEQDHGLGGVDPNTRR